jgi:hypothetical protein
MHPPISRPARYALFIDNTDYDRVAHIIGLFADMDQVREELLSLGVTHDDIEGAGIALVDITGDFCKDFEDDGLQLSIRSVKFLLSNTNIYGPTIADDGTKQDAKKLVLGETIRRDHYM